VAQFKYFGKTLTNKNCMHEDIWSRLNMGKVRTHLVQNLLSYCWQYKNKQINVNRYIILPVVLYGCET